MVNVNGSTIPVFKVQEHTIENINVIQYKISSEPIPKYNMDADAVLKLVNFYRASLQISGRKVEQIQRRFGAEGDKAQLQSGQDGAYC